MQQAPELELEGVGEKAIATAFDLLGYCNGSVLWTRGLSILQLVVLEGRWDTVVQCVW